MLGQVLGTSPLCSLVIISPVLQGMAGSELWLHSVESYNHHRQGHPGKRGRQKLLQGCGRTSRDTRMTWISDPSFGWFFATVWENPLIVPLSTLLGRQTLPSSEKASLQVWNNVWSHFSFCIPGEILSFFENIKKIPLPDQHENMDFQHWCVTSEALLQYHRAKIWNPVSN